MFKLDFNLNWSKKYSYWLHAVDNYFVDFARPRQSRNISANTSVGFRSSKITQQNTREKAVRAATVLNSETTDFRGDIWPRDVNVSVPHLPPPTIEIFIKSKHNTRANRRRNVIRRFGFGSAAAYGPGR